ncbi:hypothetical protein RN001_001193 [Aquatica leii]|uniref:DUF4218 domain-containing protein n=1 Tax=Aquatica leii TaxID=1421715 RepID=A0AAN7PFT4_9COLE|nr:hypothetical protein RN001_001193 [Aquatica leii]
MHNICLGVVRKLLNIWVGGRPLEVRLHSRKVEIISQHLIALRAFTPSDFNRKPRSLNELAYWKATEFRSFLLYLGPFVLKDILNKAVYENFLLLHTAVCILLCSKHTLKFGIPFAQNLLHIFIHHSKQSLYGKEFTVYNVHLLAHICDDVEIYGSLDNYSAFPFENFLGRLKRLIKSPLNPLQQIHRRLTEISNSLANINRTDDQCKIKNNCILFFEHEQGPLVFSDEYKWHKQYKKIVIKESKMSLSINSYNVADSYVSLKNDTKIIEIHNIIQKNNNVIIVGKAFTEYSSLYTYPINSSDLNIYVLRKLSDVVHVWPISDIGGKCIVYHNTNEHDSFTCFPLIHNS